MYSKTVYCLVIYIRSLRSWNYTNIFFFSDLFLFNIVFVRLSLLMHINILHTLWCTVTHSVSIHLSLDKSIGFSEQNKLVYILLVL